MYGYPTFVAPFTNREDLLLTVSIFDDDTGDPFNLNGIVSGSGTFSNWTVQAGAALTTSSTSITVPTLPTANQLSTVSIAVPPGLTINPGDTFMMNRGGAGGMIVPPQLVGYVLSYNAGSGQLQAQVGCTFQFEIRRRQARGGNIMGTGFTPFFDSGVVSDDAPVILAALGTGLNVVDLGILQILIPESTLRRLHHRSYVMGLTMTDSQNTRQVFVADLPMLSGFVTQ